MDSSGFIVIGGNYKGDQKGYLGLFFFTFFCWKWGSHLPHFLTLPKDEFSDILLDKTCIVLAFPFLFRLHCADLPQ